MVNSLLCIYQTGVSITNNSSRTEYTPPESFYQGCHELHDLNRLQRVLVDIPAAGHCRQGAHHVTLPCDGPQQPTAVYLLPTLSTPPCVL